MGGFELSAAVNAKNVFLVKHSELESRIDPHQYHHERIGAIRAIKAKNKAAKLSQVVTSAKQITTEINPHDVYIGLENITSNTGEYIATGDKQSISSAGVFKKGQILFPKLRPYLNKVHLAGFDGICSTEFHIFQAKNINAEFLAIYLRSDLILNKTKHLMTGNTLPRLQTEDIEKLPVPLLSSEVQQKIIEFYGDAYYQKQQKEQQAQTLLDGIDSYLLNELGITLPQQDNRLEKRIFTVPFSEVAGGRIDPKLYDLTTKGIRSAIRTSLFKQKSLKELITHSSAGDWGDDEFDELSNDYLKCLVVRATEFDNEYNLKLDNSRVKYRLIHRDRLKFIDVKANDLLIEKSGGSIDQPVGRIALVTEEYIAEHQLCYSNFIHKIRVNQSVASPEYLFYYLKLMHNIKLTEAMQSQTNGIRNLIMSSYFNQMVVLPEFKRQNEIATHISQIRAQAKQLQADAAQVLATAKAEIERMILGEA